MHPSWFLHTILLRFIMGLKGFGNQPIGGDSWTSLSGDLTRDQERIALPIMGRVQSWDAPWDVGAMSNFNTITSIAVSPQNEQTIYIGTDDGLLQVTDNEGQNWRKIEVDAMGVPSRSYVNDVKADLFDESTLYVALDNHKEGDYRPYLYKSTDKGVSWTNNNQWFRG